MARIASCKSVAGGSNLYFSTTFNSTDGPSVLGMFLDAYGVLTVSNGIISNTGLITAGTSTYAGAPTLSLYNNNGIVNFFMSSDGTMLNIANDTGSQYLLRINKSSKLITAFGTFTGPVVDTAILRNSVGNLLLQYGTNTIATVGSSGIGLSGTLVFNGHNTSIDETTQGLMRFTVDAAVGGFQWFVSGISGHLAAIDISGNFSSVGIVYAKRHALTTRGGFLSDGSTGMDFTAGTGNNFAWWNGANTNVQTMYLDSSGNLSVVGSAKAATLIDTPIVRNSGGALTLQYGTTTVATVKSDGINVVGNIRFNGNNSYIYENPKGAICYVADPAAGYHEWWVNGAQSANLYLDSAGNLSAAGGVYGKTLGVSSNGGWIGGSSGGMSYTAGGAGAHGWWNGSSPTMSLDAVGNLAVAKVISSKNSIPAPAVGNAGYIPRITTAGDGVELRNPQQVAGDLQLSSQPTMRNLLGNGACDLSRCNGGGSDSLGARTWCIDMFHQWATKTGRGTIGQNLNGDTPPYGFANYVGYQNGSAVSPAAGDGYGMYAMIETSRGYQLQYGTPYAQNAVVSFWVKSSLTGVFSGRVYGFPNRSFVFTYTIPVANTWTWITVLIPGDTGGTEYSQTLFDKYVQVLFTFGAGSSYVTGSPNTWQAGNYVVASTATANLIGVANATWYATGFQFELGNIATPFERRTFSQELEHANRYYATSAPLGTIPGSANVATGIRRFNIGQSTAPQGLVYGTIQLPTAMRIAPTDHLTIVSYGGGFGCVSDANNNTLAAGSGATGSLGDVSTTSFSVYNNSGGTLSTPLNCISFHYVADVRFQ